MIDDAGKCRQICLVAGRMQICGGTIWHESYEQMISGEHGPITVTSTRDVWCGKCGVRFKSVPGTAQPEPEPEPPPRTMAWGGFPLGE